jgi:hypothetical protein
VIEFNKDGGGNGDDVIKHSRSGEKAKVFKHLMTSHGTLLFVTLLTKANRRYMD